MHNVVGEPRVYDGGGLLVHFPLPHSPFPHSPFYNSRLYLESKVIGKRQYVQVTNRRHRRLTLQ